MGNLFNIFALFSKAEVQSRKYEMSCPWTLTTQADVTGSGEA